MQKYEHSAAMQPEPVSVTHASGITWTTRRLAFESEANERQSASSKILETLTTKTFMLKTLAVVSLLGLAVAIYVVRGTE
uniref:Uncharacterized protein n=1 Tax=Plectus sambesii TaxID=2011161 RepID=A0A914W5T8_9BILA